MPIRVKLIIMSLLFLAVPSLLIGIIGYQTSANSLNTLGAAGLHHALDNNELRLVYQPQVDIVTGQIKGVEALLRWHHPSYGYISPSHFIPIVEDTGRYFGKHANN